jgi:hypothetical protein
VLWPAGRHCLIGAEISRRLKDRVQALLMTLERTIEGGVVHDLPSDFEAALELDSEALETWQDITPLARNEWICWIQSAKKPETRRKRIAWGCSSLSEGKRRPCCWPGCPHRGETRGGKAGIYPEPSR